MKLIHDNIIYSIQKWGGISNYWSEIRKNIIVNSNLEVTNLEVETNIISNNFKNDQNFEIIKDRRHFVKFLERYQNPFPKLDENHLYHSSYYRYSKNPKSINITTAHDFTYELHWSGIKKYVHIAQKTKALNNSNSIICISNFTRDLMLKLYPNLSKKRIEVIYNGINAKELLDNSKLNFKKFIRFEEDEYALYIGDRKALYKNFRIACRAVELSKVPLVIVGGGSLTSNELLLLQNINYQHVLFASDQELSYLYSKALLLLYPSISEGFGIPLIEAQILGCPIISTNKSCIPEIAGEGAILLDKIDKYSLSSSIDEILRKSQTRDKLVELGYLNASRFSWDKTRKETIELYKDLIDEK